MEVSSIMIGLFARALTKAGGDYLLKDGAEFKALLGQELISGATGALSGQINSIIERLNLKKSSHTRLLKSGTVLDLAGIAWADAIASQADDITYPATGLDALKLARRLDPDWFVRKLISQEGRDLSFQLGSEPIKDGLCAPSLLKQLSEFICRELCDELQREEDDLTRSMTQLLIDQLPEKIANLYISLPGVEARITRLSAQSTLRIVSGEAAALDVNAALTKLAQQTMSAKDEDVFGRSSAQAQELPLLPLKLTYIEPLGVLRSSRDNGQEKEQEKTPVKKLIIDTTKNNIDTRLLILHAPFGYGKSLTVRSLASDLAGAWLSNPKDNPFPILLKCPDVLTGHVTTIKSAVQQSIENLTHLPSSTVEKIWSTQKLFILLDSFDEVHMKETESKSWIGEMQRLASNSRVRVLVASRPHAFDSRWLDKSDREIEILPFTEEQAQQWLDSTAMRVGPKGLTYKEVAAQLDPDLARTPILLLMAAYGWSEIKSKKPGSRADLYNGFIDKISHGKWLEVQVEHKVIRDGVETLNEIAGPEAYRKALGILAWEYLRIEQHGLAEESKGLPRRRIEDILSKRFKGLGDEQISSVTKSLCLSLFFRKSIGAQTVVFTHRSFREFLAARYAVELLRESISSISQSGEHREAWLEFTTAELGAAEIAFCAELFRELDQLTRQKIANQLDSWFSDNRGIFLLDEGGFQLESIHSNIQLGRTKPQFNRIRSLNSNTEFLGLAVRNVPTRTILTLKRSKAHFRGYDTTDTVPDDLFRSVLPFAWSSADGKRVGYSKESGEYVAIISANDEQEYEECRRRVPTRVPPIQHIGSDYLAVGIRGMHFTWGFQSHMQATEEPIDSWELGIANLKKQAELFSELEAADVGVERYLARYVFSCQGTLLAPMCNLGCNGAQLRNIWGREALDFILGYIGADDDDEIDDLDDAILPENSNPNQSMPSDSSWQDPLHAALNAFLLPQMHSWNSLVTQLEVASSFRNAARAHIKQNQKPGRPIDKHFVKSEL